MQNNQILDPINWICSSDNDTNDNSDNQSHALLLAGMNKSRRVRHPRTERCSCQECARQADAGSRV